MVEVPPSLPTCLATTTALQPQDFRLWQFFGSLNNLRNQQGAGVVQAEKTPHSGVWGASLVPAGLTLQSTFGGHTWRNPRA